MAERGHRPSTNPILIAIGTVDTMRAISLLTSSAVLLFLRLIRISEGFHVIHNPSCRFPIGHLVVRKQKRTSLSRSSINFAPSSTSGSRERVCSTRHHHRRHDFLASSSSADDESLSNVEGDSASDAEEESSSLEATDDSNDEDTTNLSLWQRMKKPFTKKEKDDLTFRQKLAKMGLAAVLSYGMVSNVSYAISVSLAWYIFCSRTRLSPLAKGQWKPFLAVYAGFFVFNNIIRPLRLAASVAVSIQLDRLVEWMQDKFKIKKALAYTLCVLVVNVLGTTLLMCTGILLASLASGVPVFPPKV